MKNVSGIVIVLPVKFGDHRRWSESEVRAVHVPPLRAARGGASGVSWWPGLVQKLSFSITDMLVYALCDFDEVWEFI
jgi:hypothetical protein